MTAPLVPDRRSSPPTGTRGRTRLFWDLMFRGLRLAGTHVKNAYAVLGVFIVSGVIVAGLGLWGFSALAGEVREGGTMIVDNAVMNWLAHHQNPTVTVSTLEASSLATGTVVT